ncbi:MAG: 5-formyltetrahydrofolate cyclo-ligase [Candidatus Omnitrophica bacterium]|nr:5-formyltetrahydrofolate cyclo-ligase [Candidatus Omnitrophota bacterium]MBI2174167.1 5-formyltetrahydrofolate cyclo-ligase [Candidatus Omnitrophota bacterium]MBI3010190.1 5-formyltetrahydrofolate cyclo-ligase [Candidatus Omnitrophota bacterium]
MTDSIKQIRIAKQNVRKRLLSDLKQQKEEVRRQRSEEIWRKVHRLTAFRRARVVFCYVALPYEVQTRRMIEEMLTIGKRVVVPRMRSRVKALALSELRDPAKELVRGRFGVWEPSRSKRRTVRWRDIELALVPGIAFDQSGKRLGHGFGYFDRFLARLPKQASTVGLAFRFQVLDHLPAEAHDIPVKRVLSA